MARDAMLEETYEVERNIDWLWDRYAEYLLKGTLDSMVPPGVPARRARPTVAEGEPFHIAEIMESLGQLPPMPR
jgi:hypothetical protein